MARAAPLVYKPPEDCAQSEARLWPAQGARARGLGLAADAVDALAEAAESFPALDGWLTNLGLASRVERRPLSAPRCIPDACRQSATR